MGISKPHKHQKSKRKHSRHSKKHKEKRKVDKSPGANAAPSISALEPGEIIPNIPKLTDEHIQKYFN